MSTKTRVLMVDDEPNVLSGYRRTIGRKYDIVTANSGQEGLQKLEQDGPFEVVVTDMRMPEMDGLEFLKQAKRKHPKLVYVMLTGNADQQTAINAINHGQIFRFLNKPCDSEVLEHTIRACKAQYDLIHAEAELLNNTLSGSVKLLIEATVITDPAAAEAIRAVRDGVNVISKGLGIKSEWSFSLAASLFMIGGITVPRSSSEEILDENYIRACSQSGAKLLRHISRLDEVSQIILHQRMPLDLPEDLEYPTDETRVAIGSQILRFAYDWHRYSQNAEGDRAVGLQKLASSEETHDPRLFTAVNFVNDNLTGNQKIEKQQRLVELSVRQLRPGMLTEEDIKTSDDSLLVAKGQMLSQVMIDRLRGFFRASLIEEIMSVWVDDDEEQPDKIPA